MKNNWKKSVKKFKIKKKNRNSTKKEIKKER